MKKSPNHIYDYVIIGAGLSGLAIAAEISKITDNIALLEANDRPGGYNHSVSTPAGVINNGLRFVPATEKAKEALLFLENILNLKVIKEEKEQPPVTYENGGIKSFIGFGQNPPDFYEEISYFTHGGQLKLNIEPYQWIDLLFEKFKGDFFSRSYVTKFYLSDVNPSENPLSENQKNIHHVVINGSKTLQGKNFIFCGTIKDLAVLLPTAALSAKVRNKLTKDSYWTALCLDLVHPQKITSLESIHILDGTTQGDIGPCAGQFLPALLPEKTDSQGPREGELQVSQWITYIDEFVSEDSEIVALALKKIKKQIKRVYPEAIDNLLLERILVVSAISGDGNLKLGLNQTVPSVPNLWIGCGAVESEKNLVGALIQAKKIVSQMFHSNPIAKDIAKSQPDLVDHLDNPC